MIYVFNTCMLIEKRVWLTLFQPQFWSSQFQVIESMHAARIL